MQLVHNPMWLPERVVRGVAVLVVLMTAVGLATGAEAILWLLAADFGIRGFIGPRYSPLAFVSRLFWSASGPAERQVAAVPKRFAARLGFAMFLVAAVLATFLGQSTAAWVVAALVMVLATLEVAAGFCAGCLMYRGLVHIGWAGRGDCPTCVDGQ